jgi:hypothetical protein
VLPGAAPGADDAARLDWALRTAQYQLQRPAGSAPETGARADLPTVLATLRRDRLAPALRPVYDALLIDTLLNAGQPGPLLEQLGRIPAAERSPAATRACEWLQNRARAKP